jgi:hypothetical protein
MERSRATQYIRIAVTALSLTVCAFLIALWVRSYSEADTTSLSGYKVLSMKGNLYVGKRIQLIPDPSNPLAGIILAQDHFWGYTLKVDGVAVGGASLAIRYSSLVLVVVGLALIAGGPWMGWRFSLRTLLIATTLVAVGLGIVAVSS